jgi:hypothetical protein
VPKSADGATQDPGVNAPSEAGANERIYSFNSSVEVPDFVAVFIQWLTPEELQEIEH